jgi:hypothetical protein
VEQQHIICKITSMTNATPGPLRQQIIGVYVWDTIMHELQAVQKEAIAIANNPQF